MKIFWVICDFIILIEHQKQQHLDKKKSGDSFSFHCIQGRRESIGITAWRSFVNDNIKTSKFDDVRRMYQAYACLQWQILQFVWIPNTRKFGVISIRLTAKHGRGHLITKSDLNRFELCSIQFILEIRMKIYMDRRLRYMHSVEIIYCCGPWKK